MTPRDRFIAALAGKPYDRVPYFEYGLCNEVVLAVTGHPYDRTDRRPTKRRLGICEIEYWRKPPTFAERGGLMPGGRRYTGDGLIRTRDDLPKMELPAPAPSEVVEAAHAFVEGKEEFAAGLVIALGLDPMLLSMGYEGFSYALADDPELPLDILKRYVEWTVQVLEAVQPLDFDFVLAGDDMAHKTAPFFSPAWFHEKAVPIIRPLTDAIRAPWVLHCDGNMEPLMQDLLDLNMAGLHPIEPEAMDIFDLKRRYGDRLALIGNIDINNLSLGTPESVHAEVEDKLRRLTPGGRYVLASSTCIPEYVQPENYRAMLDAIHQFADTSTLAASPQ